jgi:broad specificity phosphatase PhoE
VRRGGARGLAAAAMLALATVLGGCAASRCGPDTTVILARHADREEGTDSLTAAGQRRAQQLAHVLRKAGITAIVTSDAARAVQTAAPLAGATGLAPVALPGADTEAFARKLRAGPAGGTTLVVGHSNTVPKIIAALGGPPASDIDGAEFDNLYVLTLSACRPARLVNLQYGDSSPPQ